MWALFRHDLRMMRGYLLSLIALALLYTWLLDGLANLALQVSFGPVMLGMYSGFLKSLLLNERKCHWDSYVLTAPVSRRTVVREKYCLMLLVAAVCCASGVLGCWLQGGEGLELYLFLLPVDCLLLSVIGPLCLQGKWMGSMDGLLVAVAGGLVGGGFGVRELWLAWCMPVLAALTVLSLLAVAVSYQVAVRLYERKDF